MVLFQRGRRLVALHADDPRAGHRAEGTGNELGLCATRRCGVRMTSGGRFFKLSAEFGGGTDEAARAERCRGADRNDVGLATGLAEFIGGGLHSGSAPAAVVDVANLSAKQAIEKGVPGWMVGLEPFTTRMQRRPSLAAAAAVTRA